MKGIIKKSPEARLIYFLLDSYSFPFMFHAYFSTDIKAQAAPDFQSAFSGPGYVVAELI